MSIRFHIDFPAQFDPRNRFLRVRGWAFSPGKRLSRVSVLVGDLTLSGTYGISRPDVLAALPEAATPNTGFELRGQMPTGVHTAQLRFQDQEKIWHEALAIPLDIPRWRWPAWLPGGDSSDLVAFQLAAHANHAPWPLRPDRFPKTTPNTGRFPRISIVTPSFQQRHFLKETIASVLDSSRLPIDYVIQDGGSTDGSVELIRSVASRLAAWNSSKDEGQTAALIAGFKKTSGAPTDLMAWINSDDFYVPGALDHVAAFFQRHPAIDAVYSHRILVDEKSQEVGRWILPPHDGTVLELNDFVPQETLFWRRRLWDQVGGLDPSFQFAMDWDLLLRFHAAGARIVRLPRFLGAFRLHPEQKTAAQIRSIGQQEIDRLRLRTFGRVMAPHEIENHPRLIAYLRSSARLQFLGGFGYRGRVG